MSTRGAGSLLIGQHTDLKLRYPQWLRIVNVCWSREMGRRESLREFDGARMRRIVRNVANAPSVAHGYVGDTRTRDRRNPLGSCEEMSVLSFFLIKQRIDLAFNDRVF